MVGTIGGGMDANQAQRQRHSRALLEDWRQLVKQRLFDEPAPVEGEHPSTELSSPTHTRVSEQLQRGPPRPS